MFRSSLRPRSSRSSGEFGFNKVDYHAPLDYETSIVDSQTDLEFVASVQVLRRLFKLLNPELIAGSTRRKLMRSNCLLEPKINSGRACKNTESERIVNFTYAVAKHDNINWISKRFGVSPGAILAANGLSSPKNIRRAWC
jgi:hypothetical protein